MALWKSFYNLTNLFFSLIPSEYERFLKDEIWGCTHYMKLPMETVMRMPVQDRRYFIQKHNEEQKGIRDSYEKKEGYSLSDGETINEFAKREQQFQKNLRGGS